MMCYTILPKTNITPHYMFSKNRAENMFCWAVSWIQHLWYARQVCFESSTFGVQDRCVLNPAPLVCKTKSLYLSKVFQMIRNSWLAVFGQPLSVHKSFLSYIVYISKKLLSQFACYLSRSTWIYKTLIIMQFVLKDRRSPPPSTLRETSQLDSELSTAVTKNSHYRTGCCAPADLCYTFIELSSPKLNESTG